MKRPSHRIGRLFAIVFVLSITASLPIVLTGFMASNGHKGDAAKDDAATTIDGLIKRVLELNQNKDHQKALDLLLSATEKQGDDSLIRVLLVQTFDLFLEGEVRQGQKDIEKNRHDKKPYLRMSQALEVLGDNFRAMESLLNGIRFIPDSSELWMKIGKLELKSNRTMEALDVFREVTRLDRKNSDAFNNAAYILAKSENCDADDLKEAQVLASNARKLDPKNPEYIDTLAEVFFKQGNAKMAQTLMEQAIKLAPNNRSFKNQLERFKNPASYKVE